MDSWTEKARERYRLLIYGTVDLPRQAIDPNKITYLIRGLRDVAHEASTAGYQRVAQLLWDAQGLAEKARGIAEKGFDVGPRPPNKNLFK